MIKITVPATTANIGAGFDCVGMAFRLYNTVWVEEREAGLLIENPANPDMPTDETNLIFNSLTRFYDEAGRKPPNGLYIRQADNIPPARGLGSSSACVCAGLLAANAITKSNLSVRDIVDMAAGIEGHPDNITPALMGGLCVCAMEADHTGKPRVTYVKLEANRLNRDKLFFAALIPDFTLPTKEARAALPDTYSRADCVYNISHAALTVASFITGEYKNLAAAIHDKVHEPYRQSLIPGMAEIFAFARANGAQTFLSGAGPSIIAVYEDEAAGSSLRDYLSEINGGAICGGGKWAFTIVEVDNEGARVE